MDGLRFKLTRRLALADALLAQSLTPRQNTRYVVTSGARQKDEEWDPAENGGFAIYGI